MSDDILSQQELSDLMEGLGASEVTILVVDDNPRIIGMLESTFAGSIHRFVTVPDRKEALELFKKKPFDLVVINLKTPGEDLEELTGVFKELNPDTEVMLFTTYADVDTATECLKKGIIYDYIYKPTSNKENFVGSLKKAFERRETKLKDRNKMNELVAYTQKLERVNKGLQEEQKEKVKSEKEVLDAAVVTTAHNFNQPLTSLLLYAELLEAKLSTSSGENKELIGYTHCMKDAVKHMHVIMEQLKQISLPALKNYAAGVKMVELPEEPAPAVASEAEGVKVLPKKRGVLVVDDEASILELVQEILSYKGGYRVFTARNGVEALKVFQEQEDKIDLVLTDVSMPEMGGIELFHKLKGIAPKVKIIYMTGFAVEDEVYSHLREGAAGFIKKPFTLKELLSIVNKALPSVKVAKRNAS